MRKSLVLLAAFSLAATAFAQLTPKAQNSLRETANQRAVPLPIISITHLATGNVYYPANNNGGGVNQTTDVVWFDNMTCATCAALDGNGVGMNVAYADTSVTPAQVHCDCWTPSGCNDNDGNGMPDTVAFLFPQSPTGCAFPGGFEAPSNGADVPLPTDIVWQDYTGLDDGDGTRGLGRLEYVNITVNNNPHGDGTDTFVNQRILFFNETGDCDSFVDGLIVTFGQLADGTTNGYGPVDLDLRDLDPPFEVTATGLMMLDWENQEVDADGMGLGATGAECGLGDMIAGGDVVGGPTGLCPTPDTLITVGSKDVLTWLAADAETGDMGPPDLVDPATCGDPLALEFTDILNSGQLINWAFVDNVTTPTSELAHDFVKRFTEHRSGGGCPLAGCETNDFDGDCDVDLADLGQLLGSFGVNNGGDTDGDGDTDLADLGSVLGRFGNVCL